MSVCDPVLPSFDEPTVCWVDFVMASKVRDDAGIWQPLATLRRPGVVKFESVAANLEEGLRLTAQAPFAAPRFSVRQREGSRGA